MNHLISQLASLPGTAGALPASTVHQLLDQRALRYARAQETQKIVEHTVVTFRRAAGLYAVSLNDLQEIRPISGYCRLPGARPAVPGVVHYKGDLLSLHDLSAFTSGEPNEQSPAWMLVVTHAGENMGLMADEVMDVVELTTGAMRILPITLGEPGECFLGVTEDGALVLNAARAFRVPQLARGY